jgi:A/G-specific adenine glycosylase
MLQQTQVATVIPYFQRFLARFPTPTHLANASESDVLKHWEGLGYYRRARQLHAAAKQIVELHAGRFPESFESILSLPGIGRYTAGAVASFAFEQRRPIVEANTQRLYARLLNEPETISASAVQNRFWEFAERILPQKNIGPFNQALMELGSLVCKPKSPDCPTCPVSKFCGAYRAKTVESIPKPKAKKVFEERQHVLLCITDTEGRWLTRLCESDEHWSGLWDFPRFDMTDASKAASKTRKSSLEGLIIERFRSEFGADIEINERFKTIRHGVTRFRITLDCLFARFKESPGLTTQRTIQWRSTDELSELALNSSGRKIADYLTTSRQLHLPR